MKSETCPHCGVKKDSVKIFEHLKEEHGFTESDLK